MAKQFRLARFNAGQPLFEQLSAERLNALVDAIDRATPIAGDNMTSQAIPTGVIHRSNAKSTGGNLSFPFKVTAGSRETTAGVFIKPGRVAGLSPFVLDDVLGNVQLNNVPAPMLDIGGGPGVKPILIRCDMTSPGPEIFQGILISAATMQSTFAPDADPGDISGGGYRIFWDDDPEPPNPHLTGHFYIKIANVTAVSSDAGLVISNVEQLINTNLASFVLAGEDVVIVLPLI